MTTELPGMDPSSQDLSSQDGNRVRATLRYLVPRLGSVEARLSLAELAGVARTDAFHFHRAFRAATGVPVHRYIRQRRMEYAAYRLLFTDSRVIEIALGAGYEGNAAFSRAFRQAYGVAPSTFRNRRELGPGPDGGSPPVTRRLGSLLLAYVPHFGPYAQVPQAWQRLRRWLAERGLAAESVRALGICYDPPDYWLAGALRYDACAVIPAPLTAGGGVGIQRLPSMRTLAVAHRGLADLQVCAYLRLAVAGVRGGAVSGGAAPLPYYEVYRRFPDPAAVGVEAEVHIMIDNSAEPPGR